MSKTLFNQNTFQSKNVTNSDDVQDLKVDTFKAINLTATNITNTELQAATSGVASNLSALANKQDELTAGNLLNPNFIEAENDDDPVIITAGEFGALTGFDTDGGATIQGEINSKAKLYDVSAPLVKTTREVISFGENPILLSINNTSSVSSGSTDLITSGGVFTGLAGKQDIISSGTPLQIEVDSNEVSALLATSASASNFGLITGNILNTELGNKQDTLTDAANAGTNISISGAGVISATDTNTEYTAATNGGLALSGTEFSVDLTNTNATFEIPQSVRIEKDGTPQLLVEPASNGSNDAEIEIRGARDSSTTAAQAKLVFSNYDNDLTATNSLGRIDGRVSDAGTNIGGLVFSTFSDGSTRTGHLSLSAAGNLGLGSGDTFQDDYKMKVTGSVNLNGSNYIKQQLALFGYDKSTIDGANWGNGSTQTSIVSDRRVGDSFCSTSSGVITLTEAGMYRIRVSAQSQSDGYNDRVSFMNYLRIVSGGTTTDYDEEENSNLFGWVYLRNNSDAAHGSISFEDYIYLTSGSTIQPRQKLETGGNRDFASTLPAANIDNYLNIQIERLYDSNPITGS